MKHYKETKDIRKELTGKKVSRQRHRRRKGRKKDRKPPATPIYFSAEATVMTKPKNECTIFRRNELREEVTVKATLHTDNWDSTYIVRFTNKNLVEQARNLCGGDKIRIVKGRFEERPKRGGCELRVAEFVRI